MGKKNRDSIHAYDKQSRVARYDADMELMHPNRRKMVQVMLEALPLPTHETVTIMDLGVGTGYVTEQVLESYPNSLVIAVDGADAMIDVARTSLAKTPDRVSFCVGTFAEIGRFVSNVGPLDAVLSAYALHHLTATEKLRSLQQCLEVLKPCGWFLNADLVVAESAAVERHIQQIRVDGIVRRARQQDERFKTIETTRRFLDELEASEGDRPVTLRADLRLLRTAGHQSISVFWKEYREVVYGGQRPGPESYTPRSRCRCKCYPESPCPWRPRRRIRRNRRIPSPGAP